MTKHKFNPALFLIMGLMLLVAGCDQGGEVIYNDDPYISSHLRYMFKEPTTVALAFAPKDEEVTIDFGDGFSQNTIGSTPVTHVYEEPGDYKITVSWLDNSLERTVRVYELMALSEAMKQFKDPKYKAVWVMTHRPILWTGPSLKTPVPRSGPPMPPVRTLSSATPTSPPTEWWLSATIRQSMRQLPVPET